MGKVGVPEAIQKSPDDSAQGSASFLELPSPLSVCLASFLLGEKVGMPFLFWLRTQGTPGTPCSSIPPPPPAVPFRKALRASNTAKADQAAKSQGQKGPLRTSRPSPLNTGGHPKDKRHRPPPPPAWAPFRPAAFLWLKVPLEDSGALWGLPHSCSVSVWEAQLKEAEGPWGA